MPKATIDGGELQPIKDCYIRIPGSSGRAGHLIVMKSLPDISDGKSAAYNDEPIMGRAFPLKTYSHSENRQISMTVHFFTVKAGDHELNLNHLRALESCVYPRDGNRPSTPFTPPPVCNIKCGKLLAGEELCVVLRSYSVKFPTDVAWDANSYLPYKFDVDTTWEVVYRSDELPGQEMIIQWGTYIPGWF